MMVMQHTLIVPQECISTRAKAAIGYRTANLELKDGDPTDLVLFGKESGDTDTDVRKRKTIQEVVYDASPNRLTIKSGVVLSRRRR